jgi:hypothetical protein
VNRIAIETKDLSDHDRHRLLEAITGALAGDSTVRDVMGDMGIRIFEVRDIEPFAKAPDYTVKVGWPADIETSYPRGPRTDRALP